VRRKWQERLSSTRDVAFSCPGRPSEAEVFQALKERATRQGDTAILEALARVKAPC